MFKRYVSIRAEDVSPADNGLKRLRILASTDAPVSMGEWREILSHAPGAIDTSSATALLLNHKPGWIAGSLCGCDYSNGRELEVLSDLDDSARLESGMTAARAVEIKALRGASVGYTYDRKDCTFDESTRTVTANKWRLLELSLTPIPADAAAGIRSMPFQFDQPSGHRAEGNTMSDSAPVVAPVAPVADPAPINADGIRAEAAEIAALADSLHLRSADFVSLSKEAAQAAMLKEVAKRGAPPAPASPVAPSISIGVEEVDKHRDAVAEAYGARCGVSQVKAGNPYAGRGIADMALRWARQNGIRTEDWTRKDAAHFALGEISQVRGMRDAANITTGNFTSFVFLNALEKIVAKGFDSAPRGLVSGSGAAIYDTQRVPDFKTVYVGGLGSANLQETAENVAFPELVKTEGVYSTSARMWGGTLSLTIQALVSDDTAAFDRAIRQVGPIAQKTQERRLIEKFLRGVATTNASTWTSNTTSGCTPVFTTADTIAAARANIGKAAAALQVKIGLDGNPTGNMTRFLLAGPTSGLYLAGLLNQAPGQIVSNTGQYELVVSPWLESSAITGNSTTSYYALSDPMLTTGLILTEIMGYESVQVQEFDAGAVGARKWKFWKPFEADLFWFTNAAGTKVIPGAQQATT